MSPLLYVATALQVCAAVSAVLLARRRADHRAFAVFFTGTTAANLLRFLRHETFAPVRSLGSPPFTGWARVVFHVDEALFLTWPAGLAATAIVLFAGRRWPALLVGFLWAGVVVYLAASYPAVRGEALRRVYLGSYLAGLAVVIASIASFWWRREAGMTPARVCLMLCAGADISDLIAGAWRWGFWTRWDLNQAVLVLLYLILIVLQGVLRSVGDRSALPRCATGCGASERPRHA